jgi:hypothetical protein
MDITSYRDFPSLQSTHDFHFFFQEELVFFFFHNYRLSSFADDHRLLQRYDNIIRLLRYNLHSGEGTIEYIILFYRLLGYTRSIQYGKGDHHFSYLMLFTWYKYFPTLAVYALHRFVKCVDGQLSPLGSWRDMKYLCQFIRTYSEMGQDHSFIDVCCDFINSQLDADLDTQVVYALPIHSHSISNVAKWIPREHKRFDWLYEKLVLHWVHKNKPYILNTATNASYVSAVCKSKRLYRKKIAFLNKTMDTTQIKQCANNRRNIVPNHVSRYTQMKQPGLVFGYGLNEVDDRTSCSTLFRDWFTTQLSENNMSNIPTPSHSVAPLPIYHYVKLAVQLITNPAILNPEAILYQTSILNQQWNTLSKSFKPHLFGHSIPIVEVSDKTCDMNCDSYYSAMGYAILFAQNSRIANRVLAVGNSPTWINLDRLSGFVSIVQHIHETIYSVSSTSPNFHDAFHLIGDTIRSTLSTRDIRNLRLVIFSSFSHLYTEHTFYENIMSVFADYSLHIPFIAFWNVSKQFGELLPCSIHQRSAVMLSGFSPMLLHSLLSKFKSHHSSPYHTVCHILQYTQYDVLENYVRSIAD